MQRIVQKIAFYPFSLIYSGVMSLRNWMFDREIPHATAFSVSVISVGNITAGGTGKTPFVIALTQLLTKNGHRVGVISRGYGRKSKMQEIVAPTEKSSMNPDFSGDEPFLIAQKCPGAVVIVDADRVKAAETAVRQFSCSVLVADDAFQHRHLHRDLDIVLWDGFDVPQRSAVIPAGRLREKMSGIRRASMLVFTKNQNVPESSHNFLRKIAPNVPQFTAPLTIEKIYRFNNRSEVDHLNLNNKTVLAFCGIGNPEQFFQTIDSFHPKVTIQRSFGDHFRYQSRTIAALLDQFHRERCDYLITTEKDAVNLTSVSPKIPNLLILEIGLDINEVASEILSRIPTPKNK
ncbi:MAG: tetraacyldisaccharide 4'-kinase [Candidatus Marinimicrobia bacterium CG08_land_8_20_14_0_20_45_22]|nr:MAG: tetraacyldisaccharide 4'-kinase [Candidatus Marinimicrobia bacterium CG08_land_8_20_14_0_20_45_22]